MTTPLSTPTAATAPAPVRWAAARRVLRNPIAAASLVVIAILVFLAVAAPWITGDPDAQDYTAILQPPGNGHLLGTDDIGRDVLTRLIHGVRTSLSIAVLATLLTAVIAVPLGALSAYLGGVFDTIVSRAVDVLLAFPYVILAIILSVILGPSVPSVVLALSLNLIPTLTRIVRARVLVVKELGFIDGAVLDGSGRASILVRQILPNLTDVIIVQLSIIIPFAIIGESLLSFLGVGVRAPIPTWGSMLATAQPMIGVAPWLAFFPGLCILIAALAFNLLGDALRDELDPTTRRNA